MNKAQLSEAVAKELGIPLIHGAKQVDAVLNVIARELLLGNSITVTGFGTFDIRHRAARTTYNPQTGGQAWVTEKDIPRWRPGQNLVDLLNGVKDAPFNGSLIKKAPKGSLAAAKAQARNAQASLAAIQHIAPRVAGGVR